MKRSHATEDLISKSGPTCRPPPSPSARGWDASYTGLTCKRVSQKKEILPHYNKLPGKISWSKHFVDGSYKCPECVHTSSKTNTMQQHYIRHFKHRFSCKGCDSGFHLSTQYHAHYLWKCKICSKAFKNGKVGLRNHMKRKHPTEMGRFTITHRGYQTTPTVEEAMGGGAATVEVEQQKIIQQQRQQIEELQIQLEAAKEEVTRYESLIGGIRDMVVQV